MMLFSIGTGLERVGVAGLDSDRWLVGDAGYWVVGAGEGLLLLCWTVDSGYGTSLQTRKKGVGEGFARGRSDAQVSLFLRGKKRMLKGANMSRMEMCIRIGVPFTNGVTLYL